MESCCSGRIVGDKAINRVVHRLRQLAAALGDASFEIETIARVGYRLSVAAPAQRDGDALPDSRAAPTAPGPAEDGTTCRLQVPGSLLRFQRVQEPRPSRC